MAIVKKLVSCGVFDQIFVKRAKTTRQVGLWGRNFLKTVAWDVDNNRYVDGFFKKTRGENKQNKQKINKMQNYRGSNGGGSYCD